MILAWIFFAAYLIFNAMAGDEDTQTMVDAKAQEQADRFCQRGINLHGINARGQVSEGVLLEVAKKKFNQLDEDKNGHLDKQEIRSLLTAFDDTVKTASSTRGDARAQQDSLLYRECLEACESIPGLQVSGEKVLTKEKWKELFRKYMKAEAPFDGTGGGAMHDLGDSPRPSQDSAVDELPGEWQDELIKANEGRVPPLKEEKKEEKDEDEEEEEDEEMPEDIANLPPEQQMYMLWRRSLCMMLGGTGLVLLFSDPMVDVLAGIGTFLGIPPFYVSFILAPLASNAAELLSAMNYAAKQTKTSYTLGVSQLLGAANMNNTFCLAIFLTQIYGAHLIWEFSAETLSILFVELVMFIFAQKEVFSAWLAIVIMALFPLSIVIVYVLENIVGLD